MNDEQNDLEQDAAEVEQAEVEGQAFKIGHRTAEPTPPRGTGAEVADSDEDDDVEGQAKRFFR